MQDKKIILIFFSLSVIIFLGGCAYFGNDNIQDADNWQDEVILSSECGLEELRCCTDKEELCQYGLSCCFNPRGTGENFCAEDCTCGQEGNFCCGEDKTCNEELACVGDFCEPCGEEGQACCPGSGCSGDFVCHKERCVVCGEAGNPCCLPGSTCQGSQAQNNTRAECQDGLCTACGYGGKKACLAEPACNADNLLNNKICLSCGGLNQPCCRNEANAESFCNQDSGLQCVLGFCSQAE